MDLYGSAAEQGHVIAFEEIFICYLEGCGAARHVAAVTNIAAAFHWSLQAYLQGNFSTFHGGMWIWESRQFDTSSLSELEAAILNVLRDPKQTEPISRISELAEAGDARAQLWFGISHLSDSNKNYAEGVRWMRAPADQGQPFAQFQMAHFFLTGEVVPRDPESGIKWLIAASDNGLAIATARLGDVYAQGDGAPPDYLKAIQLYRRAALLGFGFQVEPALQRMALNGSWPGSKQ